MNMLCKMKMAGVLITLPMVSIACGSAGDSETATPSEPITVAEVGFATPESVLHDEVADLYLVSNINGHPLQPDGNGFISRISPSGEVVDLKWIDGEAEGVTLSAPKGMAIVGDVLYVTDIDVVRMFDRVTGEPLGEIEVEGATFLNDLAPAADAGVYLTDTGFQLSADGGFEPSGTDAVYHIAADGEVHTLIADPGLGAPNGVVEVDGEVWVVTFGSGEIFRLVDGERVDLMTVAEGQLDGIVLVGDRLFVSSWGSQGIHAGVVGGEFSAVVTEVQSPADIGYDATRNVMLIPLFELDEVMIVPL
ncbi:MAG: hypothetical protein O7E49_01715 [Gemmatimonadetes bacterium]|nr:hypothetical protein [Gemmatimonadota bacterium]